MKHINITDITALKYHLELGDILEFHDHLEIVQHLDNCEICRKRYYTEEGVIKDRAEKLYKELEELYMNIVNRYIINKTLTDKTDEELVDILIKEDWETINKYLAELKDYGIKTKDTFDDLLKFIKYYEVSQS